MKTPTNIKWRASGDANLYTLSCEGEWFARIQFNGELMVEQQEHVLQRIAAAMATAPADPIRGEARMQRTITRLQNTNKQLRGSVEHHAKADWWRDEMSAEKAREVLGAAHFMHSIGQGFDYARRMKQSAWDANQPEKFGAYCAVLRLLATAAAAEQRRILDAGPEEWPHLDEDNSGDDMMGASG